MDVENRLAETREAFRKELLGNIVPFWLNRTVDEEYGGFYGSISHEGVVDKTAPRGVVLNARILWTFSALIQAFGRDVRYRQAADRAYHYFMGYFMDEEFGGVFWKLDHRGRPQEDRKQVYALAFAVYALAEYFRVSGSQEALRRATKLYADIENHSRDPKQGGYLEAFGRDWSQIGDLRLSAIDDNEKKTLNTHLHILEAYTNLFSVWPDPGLKERLGELVVLFNEVFPSPGRDCFNLFFNEQWQLKSERISPGHDIEATWLLVEAAEALGDEGLLERSRALCLDVALSVGKTGFDGTGGLAYERTAARITDHSKEWWCQAEAMVGFLNAWQLNGREEFAEHVIRAWNFIDRFFIDRKHGEWHYRVNERGLPDKSCEKAGFWKGPYHNVRACLELMKRLET